MVAQDWDGMIPGLQAGKFDVLMDAISITPEREKILLFSRPYAATPATFAVTDTKILPKAAPARRSSSCRATRMPTNRPSTRCASS